MATINTQSSTRTLLAGGIASFAFLALAGQAVAGSCTDKTFGRTDNIRVTTSLVNNSGEALNIASFVNGEFNQQNLSLAAGATVSDLNKNARNKDEYSFKITLPSDSTKFLDCKYKVTKWQYVTTSDNKNVTTWKDWSCTDGSTLPYSCERNYNEGKDAWTTVVTVTGK